MSEEEVTKVIETNLLTTECRAARLVAACEKVLNVPMRTLLPKLNKIQIDNSSLGFQGNSLDTFLRLGCQICGVITVSNPHLFQVS